MAYADPNSTYASVNAGNTSAFTDGRSIRPSEWPSGSISPVSFVFTRFKDSTTGETLSIPLTLSNLSLSYAIIAADGPPVQQIDYTISVGNGLGGAYNIDTFPSTIKYIPRGSSDLIVTPTSVSHFYSVNTTSNQAISYAPASSSLASITAEFVVTVLENGSNTTVTLTQLVLPPSSGYRGFSGTGSLDLKQYR
jgi:hypothetical protein